MHLRTMRLPSKLAVGKALALALLGTYLGLSVLDIGQKPERFQWDFKTYYYAGQAFSLGANPYDRGDTSQAVGTPIGLRFAYAPETLLIWSRLSLLPYEVAYRFYLAAKVICVLALFALWTGWFLGKPGHPLFAFFMLFAFSGATLIDLQAGNISTFESLLVWLGMLALLKGREWIFGFAIVLAALFKLVPILLLALLLINLNKRKMRILFTCLATFLAVNLISYLVSPNLYTNFIGAAASLDGGGIRNPAALPLAERGVEVLGEHGILLPVYAPETLYIIFAIAIIAILLMSYLRISDRDTWTWVMLGCVTYALIIPRMKDYSYMIILLPIFVLVTRLVGPRWPALLALVFIPAASFQAPFGLGTGLAQTVWGYYPWIATLALWSFSIAALWGGHQQIKSGPLSGTT